MTTLDLPVVGTTTRAAAWPRFLCVLFFFSGFPALIYQLTWQRELFRIFGVNSESVTIVVTAFMLLMPVGWALVIRHHGTNDTGSQPR